MDDGSYQLFWRLAGEILPEGTVQVLHEHLVRPDSPFQVLKGHVFAILERAFAMVYPVVEPTLNRIIQAASRSDYILFGVILVAVFLIVQFMLFLQRMVAFWTRVAFRMLFWAAVIGLGAIVYQRGLDATIRDAMSIGSTLAGWALIVKDIWLREYRKYEAQGKTASQAGYRNTNTKWR